MQALLCRNPTKPTADILTSRTRCPVVQISMSRRELKLLLPSSTSFGERRRHHVAQTLQNILLVPPKLLADLSGVISQLSIDIVTIGLDQIGGAAQVQCVEYPCRTVGDLVTLPLGLGPRWWWRRRRVAVAPVAAGGGGAAAARGSTSKQRGEVIFGVLNTVANTVVGIGEERVEEVAFAGELATVDHDRRGQNEVAGGENDQELADWSHFCDLARRLEDFE